MSTPQNIHEALLAMQGHGVIIQATRKAERSRYANLTDLIIDAGPILVEMGITHSQSVGAIREIGGMHLVCMTTTVTHAPSGTQIVSAGEFPLPPPPKSKAGVETMNLMQVYGCSLTYARRYALLAILGLTTGDDRDAQLLTSALERNQRNIAGGEYVTPQHWTDFVDYRWEREPNPANQDETLKELLDRDSKEFADVRGKHFKTCPALQASIADAAKALMEALGHTYETLPLPKRDTWPAWAELTPHQLRSLLECAKSQSLQ